MRLSLLVLVKIGLVPSMARAAPITHNYSYAPREGYFREWNN
jgi:hypothetical protein